MDFNAGLGMARSYYVATANPFAPCPNLEGEITADICVVGGGCTGLSAALHAAERGFSVVLLEAGRIGWGASGRNGGQLIPGLRMAAPALVRRFGRERARAAFALSVEARDLVLGLIGRHGVDCDLKTTGHLLAAAKTADLAAMAEEVDCLAQVMDYPHARMLSAAEARAEAKSPLFHGGMLDEGGAHFHPLNFSLGLAGLAQAAGVRLFEQSAAVEVRSQGEIGVTTAQGVVRARHVVLACDALLGGLDRDLAARIMPVANYIVATEPLGDPEAIIPRNVAVSDSLFVLDYFRLSADGRLLFSGGERYSPRPPADMAAFVRPRLERVFPQLAGTRIDYAWGGMVSVTTSRLPDVGRRGEMFYAHGYSGHGVLLSCMAGKVLAEAMAGTAERFDLLAGLAPPPFPGGPGVRHPLYVLGMLWYALRDRL